MDEKKVQPYTDPVQQRRELCLKTYEYGLPFNYPNISVERQYGKGERHGMELFPAPEPGARTPADRIVISEDDPIVRVVVIGSACTPPGYVTLQAEPSKHFSRSEEIPEAMPLRFRVDNLWGMHLRVDQWLEKEKGGRPFPDSAPPKYKEKFTGFRCTSEEFPLAGMSCASFEIPPSKRVTISGGSQTPGWTDDRHPADGHYSFRIIRTTVDVSRSSGRRG